MKERDCEKLCEQSIAVGSKKFVEWTKEVLGRKATGRNLVEKEMIFHFRMIA